MEIHNTLFTIINPDEIQTVYKITSKNSNLANLDNLDDSKMDSIELIHANKSSNQTEFNFKVNYPAKVGYGEVKADIQKDTN